MTIVRPKWLFMVRRQLRRKWICLLLWEKLPSIAILKNFWPILNGWFTIVSFCIRVSAIDANKLPERMFQLNQFRFILELHLKTRTARVLLDYLTKEIDIAKKCTDCYRNANIGEMGWFTRVCRKPHLIVWAKRCDSNYWPGKVMSINGEEVMVQFFGNHTTTSVPAASSCFLYSNDNPHHTNVSSYLYKSAQKVCIFVVEMPTAWSYSGVT